MAATIVPYRKDSEMKTANTDTIARFALFILTSLSAAAGSSPAAANPPLQLADLRSFFHGEPAPPPKAPPPKQLATVSTAPGIASDPQIERFLRALADAIKARDGKPLTAQLADKYAIDDLPAGLKAGNYFAQAIEQIAGPGEMVITAIERQGELRTARVEFRYGSEKTKVKTFQFDAGGKLLRSDFFKLQIQQAGA